jgi:hypothetical protein
MIKKKLINLAQSLRRLNCNKSAGTILKLAQDLTEDLEKDLIEATSTSPTTGNFFLTEKEFDKAYKTYGKRIKDLLATLKNSNLTEGDVKAILKLKLTSGDTEVKCAYCGGDLPLNLSTSLDRIDNNKGYTLGNIVFCCQNCNFIKGKSDLDDLFTFVSDVTRELNFQSPQQAEQELKNKAEKLEQEVIKEKASLPTTFRSPITPLGKNERSEILTALNNLPLTPRTKNLSQVGVVGLTIKKLKEMNPDKAWTFSNSKRVENVIEALYRNKDAPDLPPILQHLFNSKRFKRKKEDEKNWITNESSIINTINNFTGDSDELNQELSRLSQELDISPRGLLQKIKSIKYMSQITSPIAKKMISAKTIISADDIDDSEGEL